MRRVRDIEAALAALHGGTTPRKDPDAPTLFERFCFLWSWSHINAAAGVAWMLGAFVYDDPQVVTLTFDESEAA